MILNCDDIFVEYEWESKDTFLDDMESDNENIPMLDDPVITMYTENKSYNEEDCRDKGIYTVNDLVQWCKKI
jgi:hypothetical protein